MALVALFITSVFLTASVNIKCKVSEGEVRAVLGPVRFTDILLGIVPRVTVPSFFSL